jgi:hypothetical protein
VLARSFFVDQGQNAEGLALRDRDEILSFVDISIESFSHNASIAFITISTRTP